MKGSSSENYSLTFSSLGYFFGGKKGQKEKLKSNSVKFVAKMSSFAGFGKQALVDFFKHQIQRFWNICIFAATLSRKTAIHGRHSKNMMAGSFFLITHISSQ